MYARRQRLNESVNGTVTNEYIKNVQIADRNAWFDQCVLRMCSND